MRRFCLDFCRKRSLELCWCRRRSGSLMLSAVDECLLHLCVPPLLHPVLHIRVTAHTVGVRSLSHRPSLALQVLHRRLLCSKRLGHRRLQHRSWRPARAPGCLKLFRGRRGLQRRFHATLFSFWRCKFQGLVLGTSCISINETDRRPS